jgi:pyruvate-formate lyase-activating enzyme
MSDNLETKPCTRCQKPALECILKGSNTREGWHCPWCGNWDKAVGRERIVEGEKV